MTRGNSGRNIIVVGRRNKIDDSVGIIVVGRNEINQIGHGGGGNGGGGGN